MTNFFPRVLIYGVEALEPLQLAESLVTFTTGADVRCFRDIEALIQQIGSVEDCVVIMIDAPASDDNLAIIRRLHKLFSGLRVIVLMRDRVQSRVVEVFKTGAKGVISATEGVAQIAKCIVQVSNGEVWATRRELSMILDALVRTERSAPGTSSKRLLTPREEEVAQLVVGGFSNRQISDALNVSESRVKNCIFHVFRKRGVSTRAELVYHVRRTASNGQINSGDSRPSGVGNASSTFDRRLVRAMSLSCPATPRGLISKSHRSA